MTTFTSRHSIGAFDILMAAHDPLVDEYVDGVLQLQDGQIVAG